MRRSISIGTAVSIQLVATFAIQLLVIRMIGVGYETDAYIAAQALPLVLFAIISSTLQSVWLPKLAVLNNNLTEWKVQQSIAQSQALLLAGGLFAFVWLFRETLTNLIFPGFMNAQLQLTNKLIGPLIIAAGFNTHTSLLIIALRARNAFVIGEVISMIGALLSLTLMLWVIPRYGVQGVVWITALRAIVVFCILWIIAEHPKVNLCRLNKKLETWHQMRPIFLSASIYKTSPLVDRFWVSQATTGSMTAFGIVQTAIGAITTILDRVISVPITATLARYVADKNHLGLKKAYITGLKKVSYVTFGVFILLLLIYPFFIDLLKLILAIPSDTAKSIWSLLILLLGYLYGAIAGSILVAVYYALGDMHTPTRIGVYGFIFGTVVKSLGFLTYGLNGLVAATSIYYLINTFYMYFSLEKKIAFQLS